MNRNDFLNLLESNLPVSNRVIGEVYELINIFPYFQSAHMLLLKTLHNNADVKFENQLRDSAIHIGDREVLYWLLNPLSYSQQPDRNVAGINPGNEEHITDTEQTVIESAGNSDQIIRELEKEAGNSKTGQDNKDSRETSGHKVMIASETESPDPAGVIVLLDEEETGNDDRVTYMDPGFSMPEKSDLLELDLEAENEPVEKSDERAGKGLPDSARRQMQSELIDKFIIANPRIEPKKEKSDLPIEDISKPFIEETGGLVTETLAKIYINQGYYSKAIEIFEKLSLKYPEKSSYFASQIEKVKEYLKS